MFNEPFAVLSFYLFLSVINKPKNKATYFIACKITDFL